MGVPHCLQRGDKLGLSMMSSLREKGRGLTQMSNNLPNVQEKVISCSLQWRGNLINMIQNTHSGCINRSQFSNMEYMVQKENNLKWVLIGT